MSLKIFKTGTWLYDGDTEQPVDIIGLDYDYWHEIGKADDMLEPGEEPMKFVEEGFLYYAKFQGAGCRKEPTSVATYGHQNLVDAMRAAEEMVQVQGGIKWK